MTKQNVLNNMSKDELLGAIDHWYKLEPYDVYKDEAIKAQLKQIVGQYFEQEKGEVGDVEALSRNLHEIYQNEAKRQGDVRHKDNYDDLPENIKEYDRVLARYILKLLSQARPKVTREFIAKWKDLFRLSQIQALDDMDSDQRYHDDIELMFIDAGIEVEDV